MKQHMDKNLYLLMSSINKAYERNRTIIFFKTFSDHSKILSLLVQHGFIISYQNFKSFIIIRLSSNIGRASAAYITKATRYGRNNLTFNLADLRKVYQKTGDTAALLLNTDKGMLLTYKAVENGVGGKGLFKIK